MVTLTRDTKSENSKNANRGREQKVQRKKKLSSSNLLWIPYLKAESNTIEEKDDNEGTKQRNIYNFMEPQDQWRSRRSWRKSEASHKLLAPASSHRLVASPASHRLIAKLSSHRLQAPPQPVLQPSPAEAPTFSILAPAPSVELEPLPEALSLLSSSLHLTPSYWSLISSAILISRFAL